MNDKNDEELVTFAWWFYAGMAIVGSGMGSYFYLYGHPRFQLAHLAVQAPSVLFNLWAAQQTFDEKEKGTK